MTFVVTFVVYHAALMPVIVTDLLHEGTSGYALIQTTTGLGAIIGAIVAGEFLSDRRRRIAIGAALAIIATMYVVISRSTQLSITATALLGFGFAYFVLSTVTQGLLIAGSPDEFRGRVMGLYTMMTAGGVPIAALIGGAIGSIVGAGRGSGHRRDRDVPVLGVGTRDAPPASRAARPPRRTGRRSSVRADGGDRPGVVIALSARGVRGSR